MNPMLWIRKQIISRKLRSITVQLESYKVLVANSGPLMVEYDRRISKKRAELATRIERLYGKSNPQVMSKFLLYFSGIGSQMTEGVPVWFRRAGEACVKKGFKEVGEELIHHSAEEDGHSDWFKEDLKLLIDRHQKKFGESLNYDEVIAHAKTLPCVKGYAALHNGVIEGERPLTWLTLKYEIELLSLDLGPRFIGRCVEELGFGVLKGLSFVSQHAVADVDHIKDDILQLKATLDKYPESMDYMVDVGERAIESYAQYFEAAFAMGEEGKKDKKVA